MNAVWFNSLALIIVLVVAIFFLIIRGGKTITSAIAEISVKHIVFLVAFLGIHISLIWFSFLNPWFWIATVPILYFSFVKMYEYIDDRFLYKMIVGWVVKQKRVYFQVHPYSGSGGIQNMEKLLSALTTMYAACSNKDLRTGSKFYRDFTMEIHSNGGKVEFYFKMYETDKSCFCGAMKNYFPSVRFEEVSNPFENWPDFEGMTKKYKHFEAGELIPAGDDIHPLKSVKELYDDAVEGYQDPILSLVNALEAVEEGDYMILQISCRPWSSMAGSWSKKIENLRKDYATNSSVGIKNGVINPFTETELKTITRCETKMALPVMMCKFRFGLWGKTITPKRYISGMMEYLKLFSTDTQGLKPNYKTWDSSENATWGPFWDNLYWKKESLFRQKKMYAAIKSRDGGSGGDKRFWDIRSLASVFHFPTLATPSVQAYPGVEFYRQSLNNLAQLTAGRNNPSDPLYLNSPTSSGTFTDNSPNISQDRVENSTEKPAFVSDDSFSNGNTTVDVEPSTNSASQDKSSQSKEGGQQNIFQGNFQAKTASDFSAQNEQAQNGQAQNSQNQTTQNPKFTDQQSKPSQSQPAQYQNYQFPNSQGQDLQNVNPSFQNFGNYQTNQNYNQNPSQNPSQSLNTAYSNQNLNQNANPASNQNKEQGLSQNPSQNPTNLRSGGFEIPSNR